MAPYWRPESRAVVWPATLAHLELGSWREKNGLKAEAVAHFSAAVRLDPRCDDAWRHLGCRKYKGRWLTESQISAAELQKEADRRWGKQLAAWKTKLAGSERDRDEATASLRDLRDPRAVSAIVITFGRAGLGDQERAVELLGRIDTPDSTRALAVLAVTAEAASARNAATACLNGREPHDYVGLLVDAVRSKITYQAEPVLGPGSRGSLVVDGPRFRMVRRYDAPPPFTLSSSFYGYVGLDSFGLPVVISGRDLRRMAKENLPDEIQDLRDHELLTMQMIALSQQQAYNARRQFEADVRWVEEFNAESAVVNERVADVLARTVEAPRLGDDEDAWHLWWYDRVGYSYEPPRKVFISQVLPSLPAPHISRASREGPGFTPVAD
jgi:hypothetical protein